MEKKKEKQVVENDEMVFGDNNVATHISEEALKEREESFKAHPESDDNSVMEEAETTRNKLNEKLNQVRDYGEDAREVPM